MNGFYLGVAEGRVAAEEVPEEDDYVAGVFGEEEGQQHVVRDEGFDDDGEEHDAVADRVGGLESGRHRGNEVGQHLHRQSERVHQQQHDYVEGSLPEKAKAKGVARAVGRHRHDYRVNVGHHKPGNPVGEVAGPENVESLVMARLPCLSLYYFYLTISF